MAIGEAVLGAEAGQFVESLTVEHLVAALGREQAILIDLRDPGERTQQGAIPGAVHAPWGALEFWDELTNAYYRAKLDPICRVVLHCAAGGRSALAASVLSQMGYTNMAYLQGGFTTWQAACLAVEDAPAA